jgi:hypothetical protein
MAASQALADSLLGWFKGSAFLAAPVTNIFLSLHTGEPGPAGTANDVTAAVAGGRATLALSNLGSITEAAEGGRQVFSGDAITFTESALSGAVITHVGLWSEVTGGTFYNGGVVPLPIQVITGDIVRIPVGGLLIKVKGYVPSA